MHHKKRINIVSALLFFISLIVPYISQADDVKTQLLNQASSLNAKILDNALKQYACAKNNGLNPTQYLTIIDYTLPSTEKRLWLFDLKNNKLLLNTWVAHGIKSGDLYSKYFSDDFQSHKSSLGLYQTAEIYQGGHGGSLRIKGLSPGFNSNAYKRAVVVHGAWYVSQNFIDKYGRLGRSWGCPAVSMGISQKLINIIKSGSLIYSYYPDNNWLRKQSYLNCPIPVQADN